MAIFEGLSSKLNNVMSKIRKMSRITEKDLKEVMREVKLSLLEADVNFKVVKQFVANVSERALQAEVMKSLTPGQQVVKIVNDELVQLLGGEVSNLTVSSKPITVYMMVGLQGSGKTTTSGKLANLLRKKGKKPLLVACDVYRPAAIKQLQVIGSQLNIPVFAEEDSKDPVSIAKHALAHAEHMFYDTVILDTAGRLHIDDELMAELVNIKKHIEIQESLLVVDAMTGQDIVNVAEQFNSSLNIDGVIITKLDGDTRGGAALSVKSVTGCPIKFVGMGEKLNELEPFYPDRMASRILGMGDMLSLIEKAQEIYDDKEAEELARKMTTNSFTLDDFLAQMRSIKKMGSFGSILKMIPGMDANALSDDQLETGEKKMVQTEAIICSMTLKERHNPSILNASRRIRIAKGAGCTVQDVNVLMKNYEQMQKMMKGLNGSNKKLVKRLGRFM